MGMFDYVKYKMECPACGNKLDSFQSKDGECALNELEYWEVDNFYDYCDKCGTWIEFNLKKKYRKQIPIEQYDMTVKKVAKEKK